MTVWGTRARAGAGDFWAAAATRLARAFPDAGYFAPGTTFLLRAFEALGIALLLAPSDLGEGLADRGVRLVAPRAPPSGQDEHTPHLAKALCRAVLSPAPRRTGAIHRYPGERWAISAFARA